MEIYFCQNETSRDTTFTQATFKQFTKLVDVQSSIEKGKPLAAARKGKGKKKATADDEGDDDDDYAETDVAMKREAELFLSEFDLTPLMFYNEHKKVVELMRAHPPFKFAPPQRTSPVLAYRLLSVSGLSWNPASQNPARDFNAFAVAVTLEKINVMSYREELLRACSAANAMRNDLYEYFFSIARPHHESLAAQGGQPRGRRLKQVKEWLFADKIEVLKDVEGLPVSKYYEPVELYAQLDEARTVLQRLKKDIRVRFVNSIIKNPLLLCSDPSKPRGTLESSAYCHIYELVKVRFHCHLTFMKSAHVPF